MKTICTRLRRGDDLSLSIRAPAKEHHMQTGYDELFFEATK